MNWQCGHGLAALKPFYDLIKPHKNSDFKYLIVRYEDLWRDVEGELPRIFDFLGLDVWNL